MPSKNSYVYYSRFKKCLRRYLEERVKDRIKRKRVDDPEILLKYQSTNGEAIDLPIGAVCTTITFVLDEFIKKAPSACMGADDWFDKFCINAAKLLCPETWCDNPHCTHNNTRVPYSCSEGNLPSKCKIWKEWRRQWRSYPEKEECQKCRYYKPEQYNPQYPEGNARKDKANQYKCYCRSKELPEGCPKKSKNVKHKTGVKDAAE